MNCFLNFSQVSNKWIWEIHLQSLRYILAAIGIGGVALIGQSARASDVVVIQGNHLVGKAQILSEIGSERNPDKVRSYVLKLHQKAGYPFVDIEVSRKRGELIVQVRESGIKSILVHDFPPNIASLVRKHFESLLNRKNVTQEELEQATTRSSDYSGIRTQIELDEDEDGRYVLHVHGKYVKSFGSVSIENMPRNWNYGSTFLTQQYNSIIRAGDLLRGGFFLGHDFADRSSAVQGTVYYRMPLSVSGLYFEGIAGTMHAGRLYDGTVPANNFIGRGNQAIALFGYPLMRDAHNFVYALQEFEYKDGTTKNSSLTSESKVFASRSYLVASHVNDDGENYKAGISLTLGTSSYASLPNYPGLYDKKFWHIRFGMGFAKHTDFLLKNTAYKFEVIGQYTSSHVNPLEMFYLSDKNRLRGYAMGEGVGRSGFANTHEFSWYKAINGETLKSITPYAFFDIGYSHLKYNGSTYAKTLVSSGVGARMIFKNRFALDAWLGVPLKDGWSTKKYNPAVFVRISKAW
jgi:hemolysin activation/secretion protein